MKGLKATWSSDSRHPGLTFWLLLGLGASLSLATPGLVSGAETPSDRPDENAMFGNPSSASTPASTPESNVKKDAFASGAVLDNPLQIGGRYYQRMLVSGQAGGGVGKAPFSAPLQLDGFLDGRPNDRLRGFVNARMYYDPTRDNTSTNSLQFSSASAAPTSFATATAPSNPQVSLDQAWLKFDIGRTVFGTVGRQHVKWGTARFWNPTDFLHVQRRDPLLPFDLRLGNAMAKFELPWEARHANFYAIALFDNPLPASQLGQLGGAFRAEKVWGDLEVGAEVILRGGRGPLYGADASTALGPLDVYVEGALLTQAPSPQYRLNSSFAAGADLSSLVTEVSTTGPYGQVAAGVSHTFGWKDNRQATVGLEYFYNQAGYSNASVYPVLIFFGQYQPFYTGRQYAALYLTAEGPDAEKRTSFTFSTLGNLSDLSFISRLDCSWRVLTYLTFESYVAGHYGTRGGEFNFALSTPALTYQATPVAGLNIPVTFFDVGLGLRMSL